jgi:hypothetical protein
MVDGFGEFLIAKTPFQVIAELEPVDGVRLVLAKPRIYFDWVRTDELASDVLLKALNPVVDLEKDLGLLDAMSITGLKLRNGLLEAWGDTKIPEKPTGSISFESWLKKASPFLTFP